MPDPNDPTQGPISPEEADALRDASTPYPNERPFTPEEEEAAKTEAQSSIQDAMEGALDQSLTAAAAAGDGTTPLRTYPITEKMRARLLNEFTYHAPRPDQLPRYAALRSMALTFATMVVELTPASREQSLALTKLSEAVMHANAAIARGEEVPF